MEEYKFYICMNNDCLRCLTVKVERPIDSCPYCGGSVSEVSNEKIGNEDLDNWLACLV